MAKCDICGKKMPSTVLDAHMAKRHSLEDAKEQRDTGTVVAEPTKMKFDYQKSEICSACSQEFPVILMPYHSHAKHGT